MSESREYAACEAAEAFCKCRLPEGHDGLHECQDIEACNGSWGYDDQGTFIVGRYPKGGGLGEMLNAIGDFENA